jgi:acetyl-CoA acetyltransferase
MRDAVIAGTGMTAFGKHTDTPYTTLVSDAVRQALADAGGSAGEAQLVYYANTGAGLVQGQESVRGQHAVRGSGLEGVPLINVENACASGSTALNQAWLTVASGQADVAVAIGAEKLTHRDKSRSFAVMTAALDQTRLEEIRDELSGGSGSVFMDIYARFATWYMDRTDATAEDFARIAVKNHAHGALNPKAQYGGRLTVEEVLSARAISGPLTLPMCAPSDIGGRGALGSIASTPGGHRNRRRPARHLRPAGARDRAPRLRDGRPRPGRPRCHRVPRRRLARRADR